MLYIVYHSSKQFFKDWISRPGTAAMTRRPYFRWAFVVICPCVRVSAEAAVVRQPTPFPLPVFRSAMQAPEREGEPRSPIALRVPVISVPSFEATTVAETEEDVDVRCLRSVLLTRVAPSPALTMLKEGWVARGCFWGSEMRKHLRLRGKGEVRLWGVGGSSFWGKGNPAYLFFLNQFFLPQRVGMTKRVRHQPQTYLFGVMIQKRVSQP